MTTSLSENCPTCNSPDPARHPAVQFEGEVQICSDPWHQPWRCTTCGIEIDSPGKCGDHSDWKIELTEVHPPVEDTESTLLKGRVVLAPEPGHFDLKIRHKGQLVFFMTSRPRGIDDNEVPYSGGDLHLWFHVVEGEMPLVKLLNDANRVVQNKGN